MDIMSSTLFLIGIKHLAAVRTKLINAVANWSNLGLALDIMEPQLQVIAKNHPLDMDGCMNAMLVSWLHGNGRKPITWQTLLDALNHPLVGLSELAKDVKKTIIAEAKSDIN